MGILAIPGIARTLRLDGTALPFAAVKRAEVAFRAEGIRPDAIGPYLSGGNLEPQLRDATLQGAVTGTMALESSGAIVADARLSGLSLRDGVDLLALDDVQVRAAKLDPAGGIHIGAIEVHGPVVEVRRLADGSVSAAGVRWRLAPAAGLSGGPGATTAAPAVATAETGTTAAPRVVPRVALDRFAWKDLKVKLIDEQTQPESVIEIADAGIEISDLLLDLQATESSARPGKLRMWLASPQALRQFSIEGTLTPQPSSLDADVRVRGSGINAQALSTYLRGTGIEPLLRDGRIQVDVKGAISRRGEELHAGIALTNLRFGRGGKRSCLPPTPCGSARRLSE